MAERNSGRSYDSAFKSTGQDRRIRPIVQPIAPENDNTCQKRNKEAAGLPVSLQECGGKRIRFMIGNTRKVAQGTESGQCLGLPGNSDGQESDVSEGSQDH